LISRTLVIVLALLAAGMRAYQGAWMAAAGLVALAAGLLCLRLGETRPALKRVAWICFAVTAVAMLMVYRQQYG
jgi:hypothetical protein